MGPVDIYALVVIGTFALMMGHRLVEAVPPLLEFLKMVVDKHLRIPYAIEPNRWMGGRTRLAILRLTAMVAISLCAIFLHMGDDSDLIKRTGYISVVQMAPCYLAVHMSYAADLLCMHLGTFKALHIEFGVVLVISTAIHTASVLRVSTRSAWSDTQSKFGVIVSFSSTRVNANLKGTNFINRLLLL